MIKAYCVDDITIIKSGGYDIWKEPLPSSDKDVKGRFEFKTGFKTRVSKMIAGEEVVSTALVYFDASIDSILGRILTHEDMIKYDVTKPNTTKYTIIRIDRPKAFSRPDYEVHVA